MAFTRVNPGDPIQSHQLDQVIDALSGASGAGQPIALTALTDATNFAETVQNLDSTNSRALLVLKSDGTQLLRIDVNGVNLGSPLTLPAGSVTGTEIANATVSNANLGPDVARANLLTNGSLDLWQRGNGPFTANNAYAADRWMLGLVGTDTLSVSKDTANVDIRSLADAVATFTLGTGGGASNFGQYLRVSEGYPLGGQTISFSLRVRTATANAVRAGIYTNGTGGTTTYSSYQTGSGGYQTLTVSITVPTDATVIWTQAYFAASCTAYIDNASLVVGSQPANYVPMHPADEQKRCERYYEKLKVAARLAIATASGQTAWSPIPYKTSMAVTPTFTPGPVDYSNNIQAGNPTFVGPTIDGATLNIVANAAGDAYWAGVLLLEANP